MLREGMWAKGFFATVLLVASGCTRLDPSHCGNRDGDATCEALYEDAPVCDLCVATRNGCIEASRVAECPVQAGHATDGAAGGTSGTAGEDAGSQTSGPVDPTVESASGTGGTSTSAGEGESWGSSTGVGVSSGGADSGSSTDDSGSESGGPMCGDGVITRPEECDGDALGGASCSTVLGNDYRGELACGPDCSFTTVNCCRATGASCLLPLVNQCCGECKVLGPGSLLGVCD